MSEGSVGLSLNAGGELNSQSSGVLRVGAPSLEVDDQAFVVGDLPTLLGEVRIVEGDVPGIVPGRPLLLMLPSELSMVWDESVETVVLSGTEQNKVSSSISDSYTADGKGVQLSVNAPFAGGGDLRISGLRVTGFEASSRAPLELWLSEDRTYAESEGTLRIGKPTLELERDLIFVVGDPDSSLGEVVVREDTIASGITAERDIRLVIPTGLNLRWDISAVDLGGSMEGRVSDVINSEDRRTILLDVEGDFSDGGELIISGLRVTDFSGSSTTDNLRLRVNDKGSDNALSTHSLAVAQPEISGAFDQGFVVGDGPSSMARITITDEGGISGISAERDILLSLPAGAEVARWDVNAQIEMGGSAAARINLDSSGFVDETSLKIDVEEDFQFGEELTISGLILEPLGLLSRSELQMSLNGGRTVNARDKVWIEIGQPVLATVEGDHVFDVDQETGALLRLRIEENSEAASITADGDIRLMAPDGVRWGREPTQAVLSLSATGVELGGSAAGKIDPEAVIGTDGRELRIDVSESFVAGDSLELTGLPINFDQMMQPDSLRLVVTSPGVDATDRHSIRVGNPLLSFVSTRVRDSLFVVGEVERRLPPFVIEEDSLVAITNVRDGIILVLPGEFGGSWKPDIELVLSGIAADKVISAERDAANPKILRVGVSEDFAPGDRIEVAGLALDTLKTTSSRSPLSLSLLSGRYSEDLLSVAIGGAQLSSARYQSFVLLEGDEGDVIEEIAPLTIRESEDAPSIISDEGIRLIIPDSLFMNWADPADFQLSISGSARGRVDAAAFFEDGNSKILFLPVLQDFGKDQTLVIQGLAVRDFSGVSKKDSLLLSVTPGVTVADTQYKRIGNPRLVSERRQRLITGIPQTAIALTIFEDAEEGSIDETFSLSIPPEFDATWDEGAEPLLPAGVKLDSTTAKEMFFGTDEPLNQEAEIIIDGLRFATVGQPSAQIRLILSVNGGKDDLDDQSKWISGQPSASLSGDMAMVVNDSDTTISIVVREDSTVVPSIIPEDGLLLAIPQSLAAQWRLEGIRFEGSAAGRVGTPQLSSNGKILEIPVVEDFAAKDSLRIAVNVGAFAEASPPQQIVLSALGDTSLHARPTVETLRVGQPFLSSEEDQVFIALQDDLPGRQFLVGDSLITGQAPNAALWIVENSLASSITRENGIRIRIPDALAMSWQPVDTIRISGNAARHFGEMISEQGIVEWPVGETTLEFDDPQTILLKVPRDFEPGDSLRIEGLALGDFRQPSMRRPLELSVNGGRTVNARDDKSKRIGRPRIAVEETQRFQVGEDPIPMARIVIREDAVEGAIIARHGIEIRMSERLSENNLIWEGEPLFAGSEGAIQAIESWELTDKSLSISLNEMSEFSAGDSLEITGLRFGNFVEVAEVEELFVLSVTANDADAESPQGVRIGDLNFASVTSQFFLINDLPRTSVPFHMTEHDSVVLLEEGDVIQIKIPPEETVSFDWVDGGSVSVEPEGVLGAPVVAGKTVSFEVLKAPGRGEELVISGLMLEDFSREDDGVLERMVDLGAEDRLQGRFARRDPEITRVAKPLLASEQRQTFFVDSAATVRLKRLRLTEDPDVSSIDPDTPLRLSIPASFPAEWDTDQKEIQIIPGPGQAAIEATVLELNGREVVIDLSDSLGNGNHIDISGLALKNFQYSMADTFLQLSLNEGATVNIHDELPKRIGNPTFSVQDTVEGDLQHKMVFLAEIAVPEVPDSPIYPVKITENDTAAALVQGDTIRIEIPVDFNAAWTWFPDTAQTMISQVALSTLNPSGAPYGQSRISFLDFCDSSGNCSASPGFGEDLKVYRLLVEEDFAPRESILVEGLMLTDFEDASADTSLRLRIRRSDFIAGEFKRQSPEKMRIGAPSIRSTGEQVFVHGDPVTKKFPITIMEHEVAGGIVSRRDLRLVIPPSLNLAWHDSVELQLSGLAADSGRVEVAGIGYEPLEFKGSSFPNKVLFIPVKEDFKPGENLEIDGLFVHQFGESSVGRLEMWPKDALHPIQDEEILYVGAPDLFSADAQGFVVGDEATPLLPMTILEDPRVATIRAGGEIRIVLPVFPDTLAASWRRVEGELVLGGAAAEKVEKKPRFEPLEGRADTLVLTVKETFAPGESLKILAGLELEDFQRPSRPGYLAMAITEARFARLQDPFPKWIGRPQIRWDGDAVELPLDITSAMGEQEFDFTITENDTAASIKVDTDVLLTFAEDSGLKEILEWDFDPDVRPRAGADRFSIGFLETGRDTLRIDVTRDLNPGDSIIISKLRVKVKDSIYTTEELASLPTRLPLRDVVGMIVHGRKDSLEFDGGKILNTNKGRIVDSTETTMGIFLPVMFDEPRIFTDGTDSTWMAFHSIPGLLAEPEGLQGKFFPIFRNAQTQEDSIVAAGSVVLRRDARVKRSSSELGLWEVKVPLGIDELRRANRWFDDSSISGGTTAPQLRLGRNNDLLTMEEKGAVAVSDRALDPEDSHLADPVFRRLIGPGTVQFPLELRWFNPTAHSRTQTSIEGLKLGHPQDQLEQVILANYEGELKLGAEMVEIGSESITFKERMLPEGANELRFFFGDEDTLSFPLIRQVLIDTTVPRIASAIEGRVSKTSIDSVEGLGEVVVWQDTNAVSPVPGRGEDKRGLPITLADVLSTRIVDNIELPAGMAVPGEEEPVSGDVLHINREGSTQTDSLFFRMPVNTYPARLEIRGTDASGIRVATGSLSNNLERDVAGALGIGDSLTLFGVPPVLAREGLEGLELDISLEANLTDEEPANFSFPFALLPAPFQANGVNLVILLDYTDGAGDQAALEIGGGEAQYLVNTGELDGLLIGKVINYPNPFASLLSADEKIGTTIRFVLPSQLAGGAEVTLRIFDAGGEQVYTANLGERGPGENLVTWTGFSIYGEPLATGVYFGILEVKGDGTAEIGKVKMAIFNR